MKPRPSRADWALLLFLAGIWGTAFLFTKVAVASIPPATVAAGRLTIAALALDLIRRAVRLPLPSDGGRWASFLAMATIGHVAPFFLVSWGQVVVDSGVAGVLMAAMPLTTVVLAHYLIAGEHLRGHTLAGFTLGFAGIVVLVGPSALGRLGGASDVAMRQAAILLGAIFYACNTILARRTPPTPPLVVASGTMSLAALIAVPITVLVEGSSAFDASPGAIGAVIHLGLVPTALAMTLYYRVVASAGPTFLALTNYLIPVVAVAAGILVLGESPTWNLAAALILVLAGIAVARR